MKIILKDTKLVEYNIELESDKKTIKDLKDAIEKKYSFDSTTLKLIQNGKILENEKTLEEYQINEDKVLIIIGAKVQPKINSPHPPEKNSSPSTLQIPKQSLIPSVNQPQSQKPNYTEQINTLVEMGYNKSQVETIINQSKGNIEIAIEFLSNGVGDVISKEESHRNKIILKRRASIIKVSCLKDPYKIIKLLNIIKEKKPTLYNLIKENEQEFKRLLDEPVNQEDLNIYKNYKETKKKRREGKNNSNITFTNEENEAIKRLKELGNFNQNEVIQAYITCDKNEDLTANYLFEHAFKNGENNNNRSNKNQG